jgi:hypothetical protein
MCALIISVFVCTLSPIVMSNTYFWDDQHNYIVDYDCNRIPDKMVHYDCSGIQDIIYCAISSSGTSATG